MKRISFRGHGRAVSWALVVCMTGGCSIQVDRGPFPITVDPEALAGKEKYLENVRKADRSGHLPNIILILADDLGKYDISTYGSEGVPVPSIDGLARQGIRFESAYATSSVCSPSRVSMLTGRYQQRFGFERQPMNRYARSRLEYWGVKHLVNTRPMELVTPMSCPTREEIARQGIPESEILLSEVLENRGYRTGIFGKWHLGYHEAFLPGNRGFQEQFGFYEAFSYYVPPHTRGIVEYHHDYFANRHIWRQKRKGTCAIRENGRVVEDRDYLTFSIADRACRFMEENRDSPFFLYVPFSAPHTPFQVPQAYYDRFGEEPDPNKRVYKGMIAAMDDATGRILDKLVQLGLEQNTLIIFASDNGGATYTGATDNGPLKGGKFSQFEGGVNIPMVMAWPGKIPEGQLFREPVSLLDLFTTCISLAGIDPPSDRIIDGIDLSPLMTDEDSVRSGRTLFWRTDFNCAVRKGPWKMVWNTRDGQCFLYNLDKDPGETGNLAGENPEMVQTLQDFYESWESGIKDPLWPGVMEIHFDIDGEITRWAI